MKQQALSRSHRKFDQSQVEDLIKQYVPLIRSVVGRISNKLCRGRDKLEIFEYGVMGLVRALDSYEFDDRESFSQYAERHIREYIVQALRKEKSHGASEQRKVQEMKRAQHHLESKLGRTPLEPEIAEEMRVKVDEVRRIMVLAKPIEIVNFNQIEEATIEPEEVEEVHDETPGGRINEIINFDGSDPLNYLLNNESSRLIEIALNRLPQVQKECIKLSFYENLTPAEIGDRFGLSEEQVSDLRTEGLRKLKHHLLMQN